VVEAAYAEREAIVRGFFRREARRLAELCHLMARRFARGGRLIAFGVGAAATDAQHVSVEFVHPVIVGKRALPALALVNDIPSTTGAAVRDPAGFVATHLRTMAAPADIALGMVHSPADSGVDAIAAALKEAASENLLSILLAGPTSAGADAEYVFDVPCDDPHIVQEVHETLYHVLWELVHVFFEHKGLLEDRVPGRSHDTGQSGFLYPFLAEAETDLEGVLSEVGRSIVQKAEDVIALRGASCDPDGLTRTAELMIDRIGSGGKVLAMGNGGSATDAQDLVGDLVYPPVGTAPVPAISLTNDAAVVTAVGNDVGFDNVFARQVIAYGNRDDVVVAISTSGGSRNVIAALEEARRRGALTVALAGYGGGAAARICDRAHVIDADYIPRIQEAQATHYHVIRQLLGDERGEPGPAVWAGA
jgi:D-sedoheptulose 7-phosphate isomerase